MQYNDLYTIPELAKMLGISRIAVFNKIKKGQIKAQKIGRIFVISKKEIEPILGKALTQEQKKLIDLGIRKTIKEYGEVLEKLGNT